ncbi:hypothetical protein ACFC96_04385 [Streptomyces sp. NPDC055955]|uniref:hypothetical protein n=1 Tax=Streptomyces sp. NPDC055955 TaxID=3345665 RepID=UPI0035E368D5
MARHPQPRHITLGGREAVALTLEEYEQLIAGRRQIGGQSARVRVLAQRVKESEELLREIEALVGCPSHGCHGLRDRGGSEGRGGEVGERAGATDTDCLRCALSALLLRHRKSTGLPPGADGESCCSPPSR